MDVPYSNREIDAKFASVHQKLDEILEQTKYTNGKVKRLTLYLVAVACVIIGYGFNQIAPFISLIF